MHLLIADSVRYGTTVIVFVPTSMRIESPLGVGTTITRVPKAAPPAIVRVAVNEVPSPLTTTFETVMLVSFAPLALIKRNVVAPVRPTPLIVTLTDVPRVTLLGLML